MPTYDFQCDSCGKVFEAKVSFADQGKVPACSGCGQAKAKRLFSASVNIRTTKARLPIKPLPSVEGGGGGGGCCSGGGCGCR